jgi:hypothetical protein
MSTTNPPLDFVSAYRQDAPHHGSKTSIHVGIPASWYVKAKCCDCVKKFECPKIPNIVTRRAVAKIVTPKARAITAAEFGIA